MTHHHRGRQTRLSSIDRALIGCAWVGCASALLAACATPPPVTASGLALKKVVIYRNGVGYFERGGRVQGDRVQFRVRKDEVGDFLATLAVLERGGSSVKSASFPLEVDKDDGDARETPPAPPPTPVEGEPAPTAGNAPADPSRRLKTVTMALDGREHDLQVGYIASTPVWRPSYRLVIDKKDPAGRSDAAGGASLQAWGIVQNLSGEDWNNVSLSLIAEAPLAFDASLATPVVPLRPTVTDGGDVIAVVPRSETSLGETPPAPPPPAAAPAAEMAADSADFAPGDDDSGSDEKGGNRSGGNKKSKPQALAKRAAGAAPSRPSPVAGSRLDYGAAKPRATMAASAPAYSGQSKNLSALAAIAVQAGSTRYELPTPVSIPDHSATMVMLLDRRVAGEAIALFAPDGGVPESSSHPFRVARFTNQTGGLLERGPLAIFSDGAFLGQGMTDPLPNGATATVPFALERAVAVEVNRESRQEGARLYHIEGGGLTIARDAVWLTKYKVKNGGDRPAKLLIKHPRAGGSRLLKPPPGTEDNVGTGSALLPAPLGARATVELTVDERQETTQGMDWLSPLADDAVRAYLADARADAAVAGPLKAAWEIRQGLVKATEQQQRLSVEASERRRATEETRANLKALEKNAAAADLRAKLTSRLAADSARLDVLGKGLVEANLKVNENQIRFTEAIRSIKLAQPLPAGGG